MIPPLWCLLLENTLYIFTRLPNQFVICCTLDMNQCKLFYHCILSHLLLPLCWINIIKRKLLSCSLGGNQPGIFLEWSKYSLTTKKQFSGLEWNFFENWKCLQEIYFLSQTRSFRKWFLGRIVSCRKNVQIAKNTVIQRYRMSSG